MSTIKRATYDEVRDCAVAHADHRFPGGIKDRACMHGFYGDCATCDRFPGQCRCGACRRPAAVAAVHVDCRSITRFMCGACSDLPWNRATYKVRALRGEEIQGLARRQEIAVSSAVL